MQNIRSAVPGILSLASAIQDSWTIEPTWNCAVQVSAAIQTSPPLITLSRPQSPTSVPANHAVQREADNFINYFQQGVREREQSASESGKTFHILL